MAGPNDILPSLSSIMWLLFLAVSSQKLKKIIAITDLLRCISCLELV